MSKVATTYQVLGDNTIAFAQYPVEVTDGEAQIVGPPHRFNVRPGQSAEHYNEDVQRIVAEVHTPEVVEQYRENVLAAREAAKSE